MSDKAAYQALLNEICVRLGFCGAVVNGETLHVNQFIPDSGPVNVDEFVNWLFKAEGIGPDQEGALKHAASLREAFVRHISVEAVDAIAFR